MQNAGSSFLGIPDGLVHSDYLSTSVLFLEMGARDQSASLNCSPKDRGQTGVFVNLTN
jgi:hypothetical protein